MSRKFIWLMVAGMATILVTLPHPGSQQTLVVHGEAATPAIYTVLVPRATTTTTTAPPETTTTTVEATTTTTVRRQPVPTPTTTSDTEPRADGDMDTYITKLGNCETGYDLTADTGNGYEGAFQFLLSTWESMGTGYSHAYLAPDGVQRDAVRRLVERNGGSFRSQFPGCSRKLGLP